MSGWTRRAVLGTAVAGLSGSVAGCSRPTGGVIDGWPLWRRDPARTGFNPEASGPSEGEPVWTTRLGVAAGPPIVTSAGVFTGGESVIASNRASGGIRWEHPLFFAAQEAPATSGGWVYAVGRSTLLSLDVASGQRDWFETNDIWRYHAPTVANGQLFIGMTKVKYSTSFDARVIALGLDGAIKWKTPVGSNVIPPFGVAVKGNRVYAARDRVTALDARSGRELWTFTEPGISSFADPVASEEIIYVAATRPTDGVPEGTFFALNAADGSERWRIETGLSPTPPAISDGGIYFAADRVYAVASDGSIEWTYGGNQFVTASPSIGGDTVYLGGIDGRVVALDAASGDRRWHRATPGSLLHAPAVYDDYLYVASADGYLIAFE